MVFEKKFFRKQGSRQNRNIPRTANLPRLFFPDSFLKLYSLQAYIKKNQKIVVAYVMPRSLETYIYMSENYLKLNYSKKNDNANGPFVASIKIGFKYKKNKVKKLLRHHIKHFSS